MLVEDFETEDRWPNYGPTALELGIRSSLSAPLPVQEHVIGAVDWYSRQPSTFAPTQQDEASWYAARVAVLVTNTHLYGAMEQVATEMRTAMQSRAVIEQAKGVIMATMGCDPETAFRVLVEQSQHENRKLRDVAQELVDRRGR